MKKYFASLLFIFILLLSTQNTKADQFQDIISQKKPCAVLIYADWAENLQPILTSFGILEQSYASKYNFIKLNIAYAETKEFNKSYYIYPNLPYILLLKDNGRMSRLVIRDCITTDSCVREKMDIFAN